MPLYVVRHKSPISSPQRDALAAAITKIHSTLFTTPSFFVSVQFEDISSTPYYIGGRPGDVNAINAHVRAGPSRPRSSYDQLCRELRSAWETVFYADHARLDLIFVMGAIVAGDKKGFMLPEAGQDKAWMMENFHEFVKRAEDGDEQMRDLVRELRERGLLNDDDDDDDDDEAAGKTKTGFGHKLGRLLRSRYDKTLIDQVKAMDRVQYLHASTAGYAAF